MRMRKLGLCLLSMLVLAASACSARVAHSRQENRTPQPPEEESNEVMLRSAVTFSRVGGFAGFDDKLVVETSGGTTVTRRLPSPVTQSRMTNAVELKELAKRLYECGLFDEDHRFTSPGSDQITYTIEYDGVTVAAMDGELPSDLLPLISFLTRMLDAR